MNTVIRDTEKKVRDALSILVVKHPVLALPLLRCRLKVMEPSVTKGDFIAGIDLLNDTLQVSTRIGDYDMKQLLVILAHEGMHGINGTFTRGARRDFFLWNMATDLEINWMLREMGFELPREALYSRKYHGKYAEKIYEEIQRCTKHFTIILDRISGRSVRVGISEDERKRLEKNNSIHIGEDGTITIYDSNDDIVARGKILDEYFVPVNEDEKRKLCLKERGLAASGQGVARRLKRFSPRLLDLLDRLVAPRISWKDVFEEYLAASLERVDYSYRRPNRYYLEYADCYVPTLSGTTKNLVVILDTSGSIQKEALLQFAAELNALIEMYSVTFIACDCAVHRIVEGIQDVRELVENAVGGGGTSFFPAFQMIQTMQDKLGEVDVILMTDGENLEPQPIEKPDNVRKIIVLTTKKAPSDVPYDLLLSLEDE